ncbi:YkgJ family cysteine cluster protein [Nanoarchaeota archaeon]
MTSECTNCKFDCFCCKMRVRVNFWERLKIKMKGYAGCFERDPANKWVLSFVRDQCYFLKDGKCQIYSIRPQICRDFPPKGTCDEIFGDLEKIKQDHLRMMREIKGHP